MRTTDFRTTYNEIKAAYAYNEAPKVHGEEVIFFVIRVQTATNDFWRSFEAPRCSSNHELERHAYYQSLDFRKVVDADIEHSISFRTL